MNKQWLNFTLRCAARIPNEHLQFIVFQVTLAGDASPFIVLHPEKQFINNFLQAFIMYQISTTYISINAEYYIYALMIYGFNK